ncbi:MAG: glycoside hydrolase family 28 protein [Chthoniobacter sp.]|uniref:glycoside hydrolase family 28 protein n=1 Tax=Chthoniobacter sp. TaxID=2510640 RepID=UPI0032AC95EC
MKLPTLSQVWSAAGAVALLLGAADAKEPTFREPQAPTIPQRNFPIINYGAKGDGATLNTAAFRAAIEACVKAGGGRVIVPSGVFITGPIELASHTALVLEKGAVIQASDQFADFGLPNPLPASQAEIDAFRKQLRPLINGVKLEDIAILGEGIIDGNGAVWWAKSDKAAERAVAARPVAAATTLPADSTAAKPAATPTPAKPLYVPRPYLITLRNCTRVHLQGVTLRNSPMFHFVPHHCSEVLVEGVTISAPADSPNTDGIDPANSREVLIRRCTIDTGDDNIAVKAGNVGGEPTENVTVIDCKFLHGHGVSIGSETEAGVRNFLVQHCTFENTGTALRIKSDRTRGGVIENVTYRDITMKNVETAITLSLFYDDRKAALKPEARPVTDSTPQIRNIHFLNITCEGTTRKAIDIAGLPESPITGLILENIHITSAAAPLTLQDTRNLQFLNVDVQSTPPATPPSGWSR